MVSAQRRTLPLFADVEPAPKKPKRPAIRTLRTRLWKTALAWAQGGYTTAELASVMDAAQALQERMKDS